MPEAAPFVGEWENPDRARPQILRGVASKRAGAGMVPAYLFDSGGRAVLPAATVIIRDVLSVFQMKSSCSLGKSKL